MSIRNLSEDTIARRVYEEQNVNDWPGLAKETQKCCQYFNIEDWNISRLDRTRYQNIVIKTVHIKNEECLRSQAKGRCDRIKHESYSRKDNISEQKRDFSRKHYRTRFSIVRSHGRRKVISYPDIVQYMATSGSSIVI